VIHHDGLRDQHHPTAPRPQSGAELDGRGIEVVDRRQAAHRLVRRAVHHKRGARAAIHLGQAPVHAGAPRTEGLGQRQPVTVQPQPHARGRTGPSWGVARRGGRTGWTTNGAAATTDPSMAVARPPSHPTSSSSAVAAVEPRGRGSMS
jgi:hypothetical protein